MTGLKLQRETETFNRMLPDLLLEHQGRWVLIHGAELISIHDSEEAAFIDGYSRFLRDPFLVQQILESQQPVSLVNLRLPDDA
ncbi:hypothetical protein KDL29_02975 [bacterium]|nr:hypothetical protein [bacterium]